MTKKTTAPRPDAVDFAAIIRTGEPATLTGQDPDPFVTTCPHWCEPYREHSFSHGVEDRVHFGPRLLVALQLEDAVAWSVPGQEGPPRWAPEVAALYLRQGYREAEASIHVGKGEDAGMTLTLAEAELLAQALLELVVEARQ